MASQKPKSRRMSAQKGKPRGKPFTSETASQLALSHIGTDRQCTAFSKQTGRRCQRPAIKGGTVCRHHGGTNQRRKLERIAKEQEIRSYIAGLGQPVPVDPTQALLEQVWEASGNVSYLRERIKTLEERPRIDRDPDGFLIIEPGIYGPDHLGDQTPHVLIKMYNDERDRLTRIAKYAIECGIAERQVRIAEEQGALFVQIVVAVLANPDLNLSQEQMLMGRRLFGQELRKKALKIETDEGETDDHVSNQG